jgi:hypothetical protein
MTLKGRIKWAQVYQPDNFSGAENWKVNFYPYDGEEWEKFDATGLELKRKVDNSPTDSLLFNEKFVTFRRPTKKVIREEFVVFSPPEITGEITVKYVDEEGEKIRQYNKGEKKSIVRVDAEGEPIKGNIEWDNEDTRKFLIPNGSLALVNFSYYDTAKGKGHRLEGIRILEIAEYNKPEEVVDEEVEEVKEVKVEEKKSKKKEETKTFHEDLDDKLPW